jgi:hypothetical protein
MRISISRTVMWFAIFAVVGCGAASNLSGGGSTDVAAVYDEATAILKTVTDKETAEAAKPKLVRVGAKMKRRYEAARKKYPGFHDDWSQFPEDQRQRTKAAYASYREEAGRLMNTEDGGIAVQAFMEATIGLNVTAKDE